MDKINDFPHKRQPNERNHDQHQPLDVNEKTPVNQIVMPYDQIKAYDMDTNLTLELKRENETAKDVNDIAFFILANSKDEYTNVENYSVENGVVNFTMPKVDTDKYYPQIMDKQGRVYSSNDNQFIDVVYNRESRVNELFPMIKNEVIEKVTPAVKQYVMDNKEEFSIKGDKGDKGEKGDRGERGKQGYKGNRGEKGEKGDRGEQGPQGEKGDRGFRGNRGPVGPEGPQGPQGPKGVDGAVEFSELTDEQIEMIKGPKGEQGPEGPKGEQGPEGPKGEQGAKGDKGDTGADGGLLNTNLNLIPYNESFWETGAIKVGDGQNSVNNNAMRTKEAIKITEGATYTFHDASTYLSAISRFNLLLYSNGTFIKFIKTINRGDSHTFVAEGGNELRITVMPNDGFSVRVSHLSNPDNRIQMKLEHGNVATPIVNAIKDLQKMIFDLQNNGGV